MLALYAVFQEISASSSFFKRILNSGNTQNGFICFHTGNHAGIREHMLETYRLFINRVEYMNVIIECRITEMFCTLARLFMDKVHTGQETKESMGIGRILAYLQKQYASATLEGTAVWAGYSKNYLCRLLKNGTGKTFSEILNSVRIHKACEYLIHTDMSAADIAANVGYVCIKHFYRFFRNIMGCTPGQYRAEHR